MAKVETTLTLEQLDAALELNGRLRAFDAGYAKGLAAGLEAAAEMASAMRKGVSLEDSYDDYRLGIREGLARIATAIRERAREENSGKTIEREGK